MLASVLIFSGWRATLAARKRLCEDSYVSTYLSASENPPMQRAGLDGCVSPLSEGTAWLYQEIWRGGGCPTAMAETVSEFRLSASSAWAG